LAAAAAAAAAVPGGALAGLPLRLLAAGEGATMSFLLTATTLGHFGSALMK
jgi:hypothetical protein